MLARLHGRAIGCGAVLFHDGAPAYVKRMWVDDAVRGMGVGRRILAALEDAAREHGAASVTLETNASLTEAIAMYRASGYVEVEPFNDEVYADHWFEKPLWVRRRQRAALTRSYAARAASRVALRSTIGSG